MNPIKKAVEEVKYRVPRDILQKVFINGSDRWRSGIRSSLEEQIIALVVRPRVLVDCNLVGSVSAHIPLAGLTQDQPEPWMTIIHVPKDRTDGRSIMSVLSIKLRSQAAAASYGMMVGGVNGNGITNVASPNENTAMLSAAGGVSAAHDLIPFVASSRISLVAENTILLKDGLILPSGAYLFCSLSNDEEMSNLQPRNIPAFADLVEHAVKSYIYNELVVKMDTAELMYGKELGAFREVVAGYADQEQMYRDYLHGDMSKVLLMNDTPQYERLLRMMIGGYR